MEDLKCFDCLWVEISPDEKYIYCFRPVFRRGFLVKDFKKSWCEGELYQNKYSDYKILADFSMFQAQK